MSLSTRVKDLLYFIPVAVLLAIGFAIPHVIKVQDVSCENQFGPCSGYVNDKVIKAKGLSISDAKLYLAKALSKEGRVIDSAAKFKLPNKLQVYVVERKALAAFHSGNSNNYSLVDRDGVVLGTQSDVNVPVVVVDGKTPSQADISYVANLMYDLYSVYQVRLGHLTNDNLEVDNIMGKRVIFPLNGDRDTLVGSLKVILSGLISDSSLSRIRLIDLRFKNPVLK